MYLKIVSYGERPLEGLVEISSYACQRSIGAEDLLKMFGNGALVGADCNYIDLQIFSKTPVLNKSYDLYKTSPINHQTTGGATNGGITVIAEQGRTDVYILSESGKTIDHPTFSY